jgi:hypothetical protein
MDIYFCIIAVQVGLVELFCGVRLSLISLGLGRLGGVPLPRLWFDGNRPD